MAHSHEPSLDFLGACGLGIRRSSHRRYTAEVPALPGVVVHFLRLADIGLKVEDGSADVGLIGRDRFLETRRENGDTIVVVDNLGFGQSDLVIGVPDGWLDVSSMADLAELSMEFRERGRDLRIATKYPRLVETFLPVQGRVLLLPRRVQRHPGGGPRHGLRGHNRRHLQHWHHP